MRLAPALRYKTKQTKQRKYHEAEIMCQRRQKVKDTNDPIVRPLHELSSSAWATPSASLKTRSGGRALQRRSLRGSP